MKILIYSVVLFMIGAALVNLYVGRYGWAIVDALLGLLNMWAWKWLLYTKESPEHV